MQQIPYRIALKVPPRYPSTVYRWGDYHFAMGIKKEFEKRGHIVYLHIRPEWYKSDEHYDIVIVFRGAYAYKPKPHHVNILWNLDHSETVSIREYSLYDYVFISSNLWSRKIEAEIQVPVECMLPCTDPDRFKSLDTPLPEWQHQILFVGNTRGRKRNIVSDLLPTEWNLAVYGSGWKKILDKKHWKGSYIPNEILYRYYSSCEILLNDHFDTMRQNGFINNRIFDGLSSGAFIISDDVTGLQKVVGNAVETYKTPRDLRELIHFYLENPSLRKQKAKLGQEIVVNQHTFSHRVDRLLDVIYSLK